ncbi:SCP-like extracellular protein family protein [Babesia divergens]|uniref:SCP-like extracellular protein family protein n=1 Tax=Babesia divergens TaxID=32595 RepID=A0AAD9LDV6_BABDI|nr:SCP-like extracellular protein family protein [Babesia divergens]
MLAALNSYRDFHSSPHLEWSSKLASDARRSANELSRRVSCNLPLYYRDEIGTNYVASDVASFTEELAARFWYEGHSDYDFQEGGPENRNPNVLSFTQLVWKSSKDVGCGVACCDKERLILVCRFHPAGNIQGYYTQNVLEKVSHTPLEPRQPAQFDRLKDVLPGEDADL